MISSYRNPLIKRIKKLRHKKYRRREEAFFVEGLRPVLTALEHGAAVETVVYAPDLLTSDVGQAAVRQQQAAGLRCAAVTAELFQSISERDNPTGLGAIVKPRLSRLADLAVTAEALFVALVDIADPGNLGTSLRTVDAAGGSGVILVGETVDVGHPTAVKASMGAAFTVPLAAVPDFERLHAWTERHQIQRVATTARAERTLWAAAYRFPLLLLMGSERAGLPSDILATAAQTVTIPMHGSATSLNLAVAAGILLYELKRRSETGI